MSNRKIDWLFYGVVFFINLVILSNLVDFVPKKVQEKYRINSGGVGENQTPRVFYKGHDFVRMKD